MNIIDLQERLKDLPEQSLMQEMQMPTGTAPQFLVLSELKRRKRMRDEYQRQQAQGMQTVAEEAVTAAGMPQEGIMGISQAMAPRSAIAQDTGVNDMMQAEATRAPQPQEMPVQGMYDGGYVRKMQPGGFVDRQQQGYLIFLQQMNLADSPEAQEMYVRMMERQTANPPPPSLFDPEMDTAPQGLSGVSADVSAFVPGADTLPMMSASPTLSALSPQINASPVDFDASVPELPQELLDESQSGMTAAELLAASAAEQGLSSASVAALRDKPLDLASEVQGMRAGPVTELADEGSRYPGWGANTEMQPYESLRNFGEFLSGGVESPTEPTVEELMSGIPAGEIEALKTPTPTEPEARTAAPRTQADGLSYGLGSLDRGTIDVGPDGIPLSFGTAATGAATQPSTTTPDISGGDGGGGGGGGGGGALSSIESRVARMIEEREKSAQADKWLALAQTGLALMASDQPTIGGAIGEAGLAGIGAMQQARSAYDKDILTLLDAQAGLQRARSSGSSSSTAGLSRMIDDARQELSALNTEARSYRDISTDPITGAPSLVDLTPPGLKARIVAVEDRLAQLNAVASGSANSAQFDATKQ